MDLEFPSAADSGFPMVAPDVNEDETVVSGFEVTVHQCNGVIIFLRKNLKNNSQNVKK